MKRFFLHFYYGQRGAGESVLTFSTSERRRRKVPYFGNLATVFLVVLMMFAFVGVPSASAYESSGWSNFGDPSTYTPDSSCGVGNSLHSWKIMDESTGLPAIVGQVDVQVRDNSTYATVRESNQTNVSETSALCYDPTTQYFFVGINGGVNYYDCGVRGGEGLGMCDLGMWQKNQDGSVTSDVKNKRIVGHLYVRPTSFTQQDKHHVSPMTVNYVSAYLNYDPSITVELRDFPSNAMSEGTLTPSVLNISLIDPTGSATTNSYPISAKGTYTKGPFGLTNDGFYWWDFSFGLAGTNNGLGMGSSWAGYEYFVLDRVAPVVTASISPQSPNYTTISVDAQDVLSGLVSTTIYIDGAPIGNMCPYSGQTRTLTCSINAGPYAAGTTHSYSAVAKDRAGNSSTVTGSFTVATNSTYTVSYDANGATSGTAPASQTKIYGTDLTLQTNSGNLAHTGGYTFAGWNTATNGTGTGYSAGGTYSANAAVTLYPKWTLSNHTLTVNIVGVGYVVSTYDSGRGCGGVGISCMNPLTPPLTYCSETCAYGTPIGLSASAGSGYTFTGWSGCTSTGPPLDTIKFMCGTGIGLSDTTVTATFTATPTSCTSTTISNCYLSATTASGSSADGTCSTNYSGACNYLCTNGTWSKSSNSCTLSPTATLSAGPTTISKGQSSTLTWSSSSATSCGAAGGASWLPAGSPASSNVSVSPSVTSNYQITCTGPGGSVNSNVAPVTVLQPTASISANPMRVSNGAEPTISWTVTDVSSCAITRNGAPWKSGISSSNSSSDTIPVSSQTTYTITCTDSIGNSMTSKSVTVNILTGFQEF